MDPRSRSFANRRSLTPNRDAGVPPWLAVRREKLDPHPHLVRIPRTSVGIVDTIKLKLSYPAVTSDIRTLLATGEWCRKGAHGNLLRSRDGVRVLRYRGKVFVEASVPRVVGLHSDQQHLVTEADLVSAVRELTEGLLPETSKLARAHGNACHLARLDLAVNFSGPSIRSLTEIIRKSNLRPRIQCEATVFEGSGIAFFGSNHDLVIYATDRRPRRGKLRNALKGAVFRGRPRVLRAEFRFKTPVAIARLVEDLDQSETGLPFLVSRGDGSSEVTCLRVDYHLLHRKLATELSRLRDVRFADEWLGRSGSVRFMIETLAADGDANPALWERAAQCFRDRRLREVRKLVGELQLRSRGRDTIELIWRVPRTSAALLKRIDRQRKSDPGLDGAIRKVDSESTF